MRKGGLPRVITLPHTPPVVVSVERCTPRASARCTSFQIVQNLIIPMDRGECVKGGRSSHRSRWPLSLSRGLARVWVHSISCPPVAVMTVEHVLMECASVLAECCTLPEALSFADFAEDLAGPQTLLHLLRFCWALRRHRRTRRPWEAVLDAILRPPVPTWCRLLLQQTYALYNAVRARAAPRLP